MKTLLTIAGFDPSSGAGVTADLAVFAAHGLFGTSCITALTVQSTRGVRRVQDIDSQLVADTLAFLDEDLPAVAIKIGMLATAGIVSEVANFVERLQRTGRQVSVVLDPVIRSSSGEALLSSSGVDELKSRLLPLVDWVTPNLAELGVLAGESVRTRSEMADGARSLQAASPRLGVVVTGGHLEQAGGADDLIISPGGALDWLYGERLASSSTHGTGCAFSSAMLCGLADGNSGVEAAWQAKRFVAEAIRRAVPLGGGTGPMELLWPLRKG